MKDRLRDSARHEPVRVRIHRCCSWLQRVEDIEDAEAEDAALIFRWIALNSLYGQWDEELRQPIGDRESLTPFLHRIVELDADERVRHVLDQHRRLVMAILEDEFLNRFYWDEPSDERARKTRKAKFDARTWYQQRQYELILNRVLERIYLLRCQLVHGAATFGGRLNRTAIRRCSLMLGHLMPAFLLVLIDHGWDADWGPLCYPPQR